MNANGEKMKSVVVIAVVTKSGFNQLDSDTT